MKRFKRFEYITLFLFFSVLLCIDAAYAQVLTGADQTNAYLPLLKGRRVALVVNQTSVIRETHLADTLKKLGVDISCIFAPEHGFRGNHEAGAHVDNSRDAKTGIAIVSLYGKHKKPTEEDLKQTDLVIFDIQDVGARFYTYISTLHYIMEACAEQGKQLIVLDRPNPNGFYVDGPVLEPKHKSFIGMHPVPVVHGMTIGEYAQMINGEKWLKDSSQCALKVITMKGYDHDMRYVLPVRPSPNLPTIESVWLYPAVCFFEGTGYSLGRGTRKPFECIGRPGLAHGDYYFTPRSVPGVSDNPPLMNKECRGYLLTNYAYDISKLNPKLHVQFLVDMYKLDTAKATFFTDFFTLLAGTETLRKQITQGMTEDEIRITWQPQLSIFRKKREQYLLYKDFQKADNR